MKLEKYRAKRKFAQTKEPKGKESFANKKDSFFVIQKHAARRLHFDFRLEVHGVLKSWAVPKGLPALGEKHLAVMVEDHPWDYRNFEGKIPKGNYGAGIVMVWDQGKYLLKDAKDNSDALKKIQKGEISFSLNGKKIKGDFSLVKMKNAEENAWLFINRNSEAKRLIENDLSVLSGKNMEEIGMQKIDFKAYPQAEKSLLPDFAAPMLATFVSEPFDDKNWFFEIKWDGYRTIARKKADKVRLYSRNKQNFTEKFLPIAQTLEKVSRDFLLDGEVVALDENGRSDFQLLQDYFLERKGILVYYVFDILHLDGYDLTKIPLNARRKILEGFVVDLENVKLSPYVQGHGRALFENVSQKGGEGIVAKKADSQYLSGRRGGDWLKIKASLSQEAIICGYTMPRGGRKKFGALVLGVYEKNKLTFAGHVGGGFDEKLLAEIFEKLKPLTTKISPFEKVPKTNMPARLDSRRRPLVDARRVAWVEPKLVCSVKFSQTTKEGIFRHPIFQGLREDKKPEEVRREISEKNVIKKNKSKKQERNITHEKNSLTNLEKIYWPQEGYTKGDLIEYYKKIAKYILPYVINRPQSLNRFPNGIGGKSFFQKNMPQAPEWMETVKIFSQSDEKDVEYLLCQDEDTLIYLANLGCIEINVWNSSVGSLENPDYMVFDIDPDKLPFSAAVKVALETKKILDKLFVKAFCKTSGKRGLHIFVPTGAKYDYEQIKNFVNLINILVNNEIPEMTSLQRNPLKRKGKVYLDYLQNRKGQTMAAAYCLRPVLHATVSTPLEWREIDPHLDPEKFNIETIFKRLKSKGDVWKGMLKAGKKFDLAAALEKLEKLVTGKMKQTKKASVIRKHKQKIIKIDNNLFL